MKKINQIFTIICSLLFIVSCSAQKKSNKNFNLPKIDLSHWSVATPESDSETGKAVNIQSPEILKYATDSRLIPFMYNDSLKGALVFRAFPGTGLTANTKYSRTELREQMVPGDNNTNWTFKQGATMKGELQMGEISKEKNGKYPKVIIMQIHGRLSNEQKKLIKEDDNNAPPMLKITWQDGKIRVKTKELKNLNASEVEMLPYDAWGDDAGFTFSEAVGFDKFKLEVQVSDGKMVVILNNKETKVYENIHMKKWNIFENYFKAGNYFQSREEGSFANVNYYSLEVTHPVTK
jgi:major membrane immunogen (membrane-anchored lipoprotein)